MEALDNVKLSDEELKSCLRYLFSHLSTAPLNNAWYQDNVTVSALLKTKMFSRCTISISDREPSKHAERLHTGKNAYVIDWLWKYDNVGIRNVSKLDAIADKESILKALKTNIKTFGELLSNIGAVINQQKVRGCTSGAVADYRTYPTFRRKKLCKIILRKPSPSWISSCDRHPTLKLIP